MMTDISVTSAPTKAVAGEAPLNLTDAQGAGANQFDLPTTRRTLARLLRVWAIGLLVFGYGPAFTYGKLIWLFNDYQWRWTYFLYVTEVPLIGGFCIILLPLLWYRPIHRAVAGWFKGTPVDRQHCAQIYERALRLPWRVALSAFAAAVFGYLVGIIVLHQQTNQPWVEIVKTLPAIPLVGGMMGAYCYFGTIRALHPIVAWCSTQLRQIRPIRQGSLAQKFLTTTIVLAVALLCLLQPAAYTLGQVVTERHLAERAIGQLRTTTYRLGSLVRPEDQWAVLKQTALGSHGYLFAMNPEGQITNPHPFGYRHVDQEQFYRLDQQLQGREGVWVDRVGRHRVVAFVRGLEPAQTFISVSFPSDFYRPLHQYMELSWIILCEIFFVIFLFGRYYTRGITIPLGELSRAAQRIADHGDLSAHVPVTTNDELGELARSFNRMVERLQESKANLEDYTKRLERSTQELSAINQEMEDLLRVVSHDLRAPLINIQGFSKRLEPLMQETVRTLDQLASRSQENGLRDQVQALKSTVEDRFSESLQFISKSVEKMDALLSSLLAVSRVGRKADSIRPNDLDGILDDVLATFDHQLKEKTIQVIRHPLPRAVPCRRNEINQVFSNLIANAINYMGPSGQRFIEIGGTDHEDHVECFVRDTGIGIHPDDHERIFQMFTRLQAIDVPGEGVGLAYVKKILRSHGGKIWVVSQRGQGSTFFLSISNHQKAARG